MFAEDHNLDFNEVKKKLAICGPPMTNNTTVRNIFFPISFFAHQNLFLKWWNTIKSLPNILFQHCSFSNAFFSIVEVQGDALAF